MIFVMNSKEFNLLENTKLKEFIKILFFEELLKLHILKIFKRYLLHKLAKTHILNFVIFFLQQNKLFLICPT